jgi:hypothetical protein
MPFFHALTGSDSTTFFFKKSKIHLFRTWQNSMNYDELTATFQRLSWLSSEASITASYPILQQFIIAAYGGKQNYENLDKFRLDLFKTASSNNLRDIPPSKKGLSLHIRRSAFQAGWIWGNTTSQECSPPPDQFGWKVFGSKLAIVWSSSARRVLLKRITKTCTCKSGPNVSAKLCDSCVCGRDALSYIEQGKCKRSCRKQDDAADMSTN